MYENERLIPQNWRGGKMFEVMLDSSPAIERLCELARLSIGRLTLRERLICIKAFAHEMFPVNAVVCANDLGIAGERRNFFSDFVSVPTEEQTHLSYAAEHGMACCRYYHALLFVALHEADIAVRACGKMLPGKKVGYTWVEVAIDNKTETIDLFAESVVLAGRPDLNYDDPSGKYQKPELVWTNVF